MKYPTVKGRELAYLSLFLVLSTILVLLDLSILHNQKISEFLNNYKMFNRLDLVFKLVFLYSLVFMGILYRRWKRSLSKQHNLENIISSINPAVLMVVDNNEVITMCNQSIKRILNYEINEVLYKKTDALFAEVVPQEQIGDDVQEMIAQDGFNVKSAVGIKKEGQEIPLEIIWGALGKDQGRVLLLRDISERKRADEALKELTKQLQQSNEELTRLVNIDPLTEVLNRRGFEDVLVKEVHRASREDSSLAAILLDCDDFKNINDVLGHGVGDVVLKEIAQRLKGALRTSDQIARIGGDEFVILLPNTRWAEAISVAEKLRHAVSASLLISGNKPVTITASLGVSLITGKVSSIEEILALTRLPLQRSKQQGKNIITTSQGWSSNEKGNTPVIMQMKESLLQDDCLFAAAQEIYRLQDNTLEGYELLVRCTIDVLKNPNDFLLFSLEHSILTHVDLRCLKTCIAATENLTPNLSYHINLFPSTIFATPMDRLIDIFPLAQNPEGTFIIEISEQQFIGDLNYLKQYLSGLKEAGILIAIDDLGFGRSSMESLIVLEPDIIKIDRKYVSGIASDASTRRSLERLLRIVENLDAKIVTEGIETAEELAILKELGVEFGQGFLWGRPKKVAAAELKRYQSNSLHCLEKGM